MTVYTIFRKIFDFFWKNHINITFKSCQPQKALGCISQHVFEPLIVTTRLNYENSYDHVHEMAAFMNCQPFWTPSWISQNAQGWPKSTRQILKMDHLGYSKRQEKLSQTFQDSTPFLSLMLSGRKYGTLILENSAILFSIPSTTIGSHCKAQVDQDD